MTKNALADVESHSFLKAFIYQSLSMYGPSLLVANVYLKSLTPQVMNASYNQRCQKTQVRAFFSRLLPLLPFLLPSKSCID